MCSEFKIIMIIASIFFVGLATQAKLTPGNGDIQASGPITFVVDEKSRSACVLDSGGHTLSAETKRCRDQNLTLAQEIDRNLKTKNSTALVPPTYKFAAGVGCVSGVVVGGVWYAISSTTTRPVHELFLGTLAFYCNGFCVQGLPK